MGIEDKGSQGRLGITLRGRDPFHDSLEDIFDPRALLGRAPEVTLRIQPQFRINLFHDPLHVRRG